MKAGFPLALALAGLAGGPALADGKHPGQAVLEEKCLACHGKAQMSGLDLRSRASLLLGGKRGPAAIPGDASSSLLIEAVERTGELAMPPGDRPLEAAEIAALEDWIDQGAPWSEDGSAGAIWWSFRKPVRPDGESIDEFIQATLQELPIKGGWG